METRHSEEFDLARTVTKNIPLKLVCFWHFQVDEDPIAGKGFPLLRSMKAKINLVIAHFIPEHAENLFSFPTKPVLIPFNDKK